MTQSSEIYIQSTETDPGVRAEARIREGHQRLRAGLAALSGPQPDDAARDAGHRALVAFCTGELRSRLAAADETLWAAASGAAETRLLVRALRVGRLAIERHTDALADADADAASATAHARSIEALLTVQLTTEDEVLLPALAAIPGADLPALAADLQTVLDGGRLEDPDVIDVREIPHGRRHPRIFGRYARLAAGEDFILVNNHDPKPLRREFEATHPGAYTWEYVESGPEQWQVRIGRIAAGE